jgi:hypothetical protein
MPLTPEQKERIGTSGESERDLARTYGVSAMTIRKTREKFRLRRMNAACKVPLDNSVRISLKQASDLMDLLRACFEALWVTRLGGKAELELADEVDAAWSFIALKAGLNSPDDVDGQSLCSKLFAVRPTGDGNGQYDNRNAEVNE